jgi:hypothetical protein
MKKLFALILTSISFLFIGPAVYSEGNVAANVATPQIRVEIGPRQRRGRDWRNRDYRNYRNRRTYTQTRYVRYGWNTYRETYQTTYYPNGRTQTVLVGRVRVS